ncbi:hypothetical protein [Nocardia salmonicida]|uniref:hypothetical protein n=1 Tax=Nocardia salmonicida TaxID=53431 RepID=UPI0036386024
MSPDEVLTLLQVAQSYDSRNIDRLMQLAWVDAAQRQRWTRDGAVQAIRAHYAESTDRIMPGHITARIRTQRAMPFAPTYRRALTAAPPASPEQRAAARALFAPKARTRDLRKRRLRHERVPDGTEFGAPPAHAFTGALGGILGALRTRPIVEQEH